MPAWALSLLAATVLALGELASGALVFLSFAASLLVVAAVEYFAGGAAWWRDLSVFAAMTALCLTALRLRFRRRADAVRAVGDINEY